MSATVYYIESLTPSWLATDTSYRAALVQHLLALMALQEYTPVAEPVVSVAPCDVDPPVGMTLLRATVYVEEFDLDLDDDEEPAAGGQWFLRQTDDFTAHAVPLDDVILHSFTTDCSCGPTPRPTPRGDGSQGWVISHHSLDGRELTEPDYGTPPE